ncbi:hypothetical protein QF023_000434 [Chryseobacterium sp. SLBN-27]|uniref:hypothetical protein n=1 Tax=Chryseobacterium TaxID=59732 RepID=UPI002859AE09|nr:hypothetical protein [Chryseobacterium sp. SLBN-27]MDR6156918.1 hypothetical protein [Chryseobacterium sp. SLBN-27]
MTISKLKIDLRNLFWNFFDQQKQIIDEFLKGNNDPNVVNSFIKLIAKTELTLQLEEDFDYMDFYRMSYIEVDKDLLYPLKQNNLLPLDINYKGRLYSNFKYLNQEFINVVTSEKISKLGSDGVPCIINIFDNIMTFYFFEWDYNDLN